MELMVHLFALCLVHSFQFCGRVLELSVSAASDGGHQLQIREHLLEGTVRGLELGITLGFQEQLRLFENALPDLG